MSYECPYCGEELTYHDTYGMGIPFRPGFRKIGDVFKCLNEECEAHEERFYTKNDNGELYEGIPY